jgi:hypothetical protein
MGSELEESSMAGGELSATEHCSGGAVGLEIETFEGVSCELFNHTCSPGLSNVLLLVVAVVADEFDEFIDPSPSPTEHTLICNQ